MALFWLAETSHKPTSQTTWLNITPDCDHCNHWLDTSLQTKLAFQTSHAATVILFPRKAGKGYPTVYFQTHLEA
eukprot:1159819-Pelagomonas_calceolata.AAC.3